MAERPPKRSVFAPIERLRVHARWNIYKTSEVMLWPTHGKATVIELPVGKFKGYQLARTRDRAYNSIASALHKHLLWKLPLALRLHREGRQNDLTIWIPDARVLIPMQIDNLSQGLELHRRLRKAGKFEITLPGTGKVITTELRNPENRQECAERLMAAQLTLLVMKRLTRIRNCDGEQSCHRAAWPLLIPKLRGGEGLSKTMCPSCETKRARRNNTAWVKTSRTRKRELMKSSPEQA